ncbi:E3 ubiquitin-protein ligase [Dictyocoela muelleri]|nr:E3 ubiquitin-protein ligase [Dictyocoela muelleri]
MFGKIKSIIVYLLWYLKNNNIGEFSCEFEEKIAGVNIIPSLYKGILRKYDYGDFFVLKNEEYQKKCLLFVKPHVDFSDFVVKAAQFQNIFAVFKLNYNDLKDFHHNYYNKTKNVNKNHNENHIYDSENNLKDDPSYKNLFSDDIWPIKTKIQEKLFLDKYFSLMISYLKKNIKITNVETTTIEYLNQLIQFISGKTFPFSIFLLNDIQTQLFYEFKYDECTFIVYKGRDGYVNIVLFILIFIILICLFMLFKIWMSSQSTTPLITPPELNSCQIIHFKDINPKTLKNCTICLNDFDEMSICRILYCNHYFHSECVDPWLINMSARCPYCRKAVKFGLNI